MFSTDTAPANGISAVKAIQLAAAKGQKIYTITQENLGISLEQISLPSEVEADIRNAVNAGMEVTAHERPVDFFGKPSVGYILIDSVTGAGAYRIGGGENGASVADYGYSAAGMLSTSVAFGFGLIEAVYAVLKIAEPLLRIVAKYVGIIGQVMVALDLLVKCSNASSSNLAGLMFLMMFFLIITVLIVSFAGIPMLWGLLIVAVSNLFSQSLMGLLTKMTPGCDK